METKRMTLANMQGKLSRAEMKNILGGTVLPPDDGGAVCSTSKCTYPDGLNPTIWKEGTCTANTNPMQVGCACKKQDQTLVADTSCNVKPT